MRLIQRQGGKGGDGANGAWGKMAQARPPGPRFHASGDAIASIINDAQLAGSKSGIFLQVIRRFGAHIGCGSP
jgi:hypothetical protein